VTPDRRQSWCPGRPDSPVRRLPMRTPPAAGQSPDGALAPKPPPSPLAEIAEPPPLGSRRGSPETERVNAPEAYVALGPPARPTPDPCRPPLPPLAHPPTPPGTPPANSTPPDHPPTGGTPPV